MSSRRPLSAQPQKTLKPRWSTSQSLKRDSFPKTTTTCSSAPGRSPSYGAVGRPHFQARKTQAILASPAWASAVAVLPHCNIIKTRTLLLRTSPPVPRALTTTLPKVTGTRAGAQPTRAGCTGANSGPINGAVSRPQKWGREMGPEFLQYNLELNTGVVKPRPQKLSPPGGPNFGAANSSIFRLNLALFTRGPQTSAQSGKLRTTTSAGSFLVEVSDLVNMRETCTGEAHAREARIVEIFRPQIWTCANWQLLQTCVRDIARPLRPHPAGFEAFRGLPKPYSWGFEASLMGFRGLSRPGEASTKSQNPFSLKDYEASGTGAYNTIEGVPAKPRARTNPGCLSSFP